MTPGEAIHRATEIVADHYRLTHDQARELLRRMSAHTRVTMHAMAEGIIVRYNARAASRARPDVH